MIFFFDEYKEKKRIDWISIYLILLAIILIILICINCSEARELNATWYSVESLKKEGTWNRTKGVMANGEKFNDYNLTCATRLFPLGSILLIRNIQNSKIIKVVVTDRIGKRFATTRIDLSKRAFALLDELDKGRIKVKVERI